MTEGPTNKGGFMPYLVVKDIHKSIDFYVNAWGFKLLSKNEHHGMVVHAILSYGSSTISLDPEGRE
jgi:uncharacterized glyoxalase superfamily protein PhnB